MAVSSVPPHGALFNVDYARSRLAYDPETGLLRWRQVNDAKAWNTKYAGHVTGAKGSSGYLIVRLCSGNHYAHRLAWLIQTDSWPSQKVDHINGDRLDNSWLNLRLADDVENSINQKRRSDNTSGFKGVSWNKRDQLWEAYINVGCARRRLGRFASITDARDAYRAAAAELHGRFSRLE